MHQLLDDTAFQMGYAPLREPQADDYCVIYCGDSIYLPKQNQLPSFSDLQALPLECGKPYYLGVIDGQACFIVSSEQSTEAFVPLKPTHASLPLAQFQAAAFGHHLHHWLNTHRYCGACGSRFEPFEKERAMRCTGCGYLAYPKISPCVIVLVRDGSKFLLARSPHFRQGLYSILAGFIEIGESAEQAVHRELMEEVGVRVKNVRYITSQPWPFPSSLMLGFVADYDGGELKPDGVEIEAADWFDAEHLPEHLPHELSISSYLIRLFLDGKL